MLAPAKCMASMIRSRLLQRVFHHHFASLFSPHRTIQTLTVKAADEFTSAVVSTSINVLWFSRASDRPMTSDLGRRDADAVSRKGATTRRAGRAPMQSYCRRHQALSVGVFVLSCPSSPTPFDPYRFWLHGSLPMPPVARVMSFSLFIVRSSSSRITCSDGYWLLLLLQPPLLIRCTSSTD
jgi:hypothetical protein